jgi:hypothetical protein
MNTHLRGSQFQSGTHKIYQKLKLKFQKFLPLNYGHAKTLGWVPKINWNDLILWPFLKFSQTYEANMWPPLNLAHEKIKNKPYLWILIFNNNLSNAERISNSEKKSLDKLNGTWPSSKFNELISDSFFFYFFRDKFLK